jgi:Fe-S-cluster formation regulator IscX/YfhJ
MLRIAVDASADESGWAYLGNVGQNIANQAPEFDPRNYGFKKLGEIIKAVQIFDIEERSSTNSPGASIYIRDKRKKNGEK